MRHPSHETRISMDASTYDEICIHCGATDITGGGWGRLAAPCPEDQRLYDAAREASHATGFPWTDPRTGITYPPPTAGKEQV